MIYKTADLHVCEDCLLWLANADSTGLGYHYSADTAAALLERIQEGEKLLKERQGAIHATTCTSELSRSGCDCCGRFEGSTMPLTPMATYVNPVGRKMGDILYPSESHYLDHRFILSAAIDELWWQKQGLSYTATGYGKKIPTRYVVQCADNRKRRVYCACFGNSGSLYIQYKGQDLTLDVDAETKLEAVR